MPETSMRWEQSSKMQQQRQMQIHRQEMLNLLHLRRQVWQQGQMIGPVQNAAMNTTMESSVPSAEQRRRRIGPARNADIQEIRESSAQNAVIKKTRN